MRLRRGAAGCAFAAWLGGAPDAFAHSPIAGLGVFYSHFLDPVVVPAHALLLIATALMLGQQGRGSARTGILALAAVFACGLAVSASGLHASISERALLVGAVAIGAAVSFGRPLSVALVASAAALAGLALGLDSEGDGATRRENILVFAGLAAGVLYFATLIAGLTVTQKQAWLRIGVRIVGSWIVAAAVMVLALSISPKARRTASIQTISVALHAPC